MPGKPAARLGDAHTCPAAEGPKPHTGGPIIPPCCTSVLIGGPPAARVGDKATCVGPLDVIAKGSPTVFIGKRPAARMGDKTAHGGVIVKGEFTVLIGGGKGGAAGTSTVDSSSGKAEVSFAFSKGEAGTPGSSKSPDAAPVEVIPEAAAIADELLDNDKIVIDTKGAPPDFVFKVYDNLKRLVSVPSGGATLAKIRHSGKTVTIKWANSAEGRQTSCKVEDLEGATKDGLPLRNSSGKVIDEGPLAGKKGTGKGSDVTVYFDPDETHSNNLPGAEPMPTDAALWHELEHGSHAMSGTINGHPDDDFDTVEERRTITDGSPNEAQYLEERGYPYRRNGHSYDSWERVEPRSGRAR